MLDKLKNIFYKIILIILAVFVAYVCYCSVFKIYGTQEELKPIIIIIGTIFMIIGLICVKRIIDKIDDKKINIIAIILSIVFFILMSLIGNIYSSIPTYDLSSVITEAYNMIENGGKINTSGYLAMATNQTPITILIYIIFKIASIIGLSGNAIMGFATVINSLFIAITAYFSYLSVKKMKNSKAGLITLLFFVINPIFYLYSSYFYTDTMCMPFTAISMYLMICVIKTSELKRKVIYSVVAGLVLSIGFEIRVVLGILIVGFILGQILNKEPIKNKVITIICIILGFMFGVGMFSIFSKQFGVIENNNKELPITHYLMLGLNSESDGRWNLQDFNYTTSRDTHEEKVDANIQEIGNRLKKYGISGYLDLLINKLEVNWSNGDYDYLSKLNNVVKEKKRGYEYVEGNKILFILYYLQICKVVLFVLFLVSIIAEIRRNTNFKYIYISIFGMFIFYLFWEVLSRYSLTCLPWIIMLIYIGIEKLQKIVESNEIKIVLEDNTEKSMYLYNVIKKTIVIITVLSAVLLIINFDKFCIQKDTYYDKVTMLRRSNSEGTVENIYNKDIEQTFIANKKFNSITLVFQKQKDNDIENIYYFVILDEKGNELVRQQFNSKDIENEQSKKFKFDYIIPNGNQKYTMRIYTDSNMEDSINIKGFKTGKNYSVYEVGELKINDEEQLNHDLVFRVENQNKRVYMSKKYYLIISITIILIEICIAIMFEKKNKLLLEK